MKSLVFLLALLLWPVALGPEEEATFFIEKWPTIIMSTGSFAYEMERPGGEIKCLNIKLLERKE